MKKIVIAPDKFKGSLTGIAFCSAIERGIRKHLTEVEILHLPLADGGDGTIDALNYYIKGDIISLEVNNPLFQKINAVYLYSTSQKIAFIEMAAASGINLLQTEQLNPLKTSTYGTGELILDALNRGVKHIILGIGGSATNDAGIGMAKALGYNFFDINNCELDGVGENLIKIASIDNSQVRPELKHVKFDVACDVNNPLFGKNGAAYVYAPQKGATLNMVKQLDTGLVNFNNIVKQQFGINLQDIHGSGAAGGLGAGCVLFCNGQLISGIDLIKTKANFNHNIKDADWIITGEGKLDKQTLSGKVIIGICESISNQKLAIFCGINQLNMEELENLKISYLTETYKYAKDENDSMKNAALYLEKAAEDFAKKHLI